MDYHSEKLPVDVFAEKITQSWIWMSVSSRCFSSFILKITVCESRFALKHSKLKKNFQGLYVFHCSVISFFLRKEVIQPHLPIRLPCYDFTPVIGPTFGSSFLAVRSLTSGVADSHGVTGGVYKTRERIHRGILIRDY